MALAFIVLLALLALAWVALWVSPAHRSGFADVLDADVEAGRDAAAGRTRVILIAPARNESAVLPATVPTYCQQSHRNLRVMIVDDQSDDATPTVLAELSAQVPNLLAVRTGPRPLGWIGKTWAVASGVREANARGGGSPGDDDVYVFTDADCALHAHAVATAVREMRERRLDLLSVVPRMEFGPACEKVGLPGLLTVLSIVFPLGKVNDPASPLAMAAGGFIAIRRAAYQRLGGHEAVRQQIVEDVNLARLAKSSGARINARLTRNLVWTRMYDGWPDMWEGLAKNAYAGMDFQPRKFWVGLVVGTVMMVLPPLYVAGNVAWVAAGLQTKTPTPTGWVALALSVVVLMAQAAVHHRTVRHMGLASWHALLMPVSVALYLAIACDSAYQHHFRGGNVWKGRRCEGTEPAGAAGAAGPGGGETT